LTPLTLNTLSQLVLNYYERIDSTSSSSVIPPSLNCIPFCIPLIFVILELLWCC